MESQRKRVRVIQTRVISRRGVPARRRARTLPRSFGAKGARINQINARSGNTAMHAPVARGTTEKKHMEIPPATYLVNTTPVFTLANGLGAGSNYYQLEGLSCKAKSLFLTGFFFPIRTVAVTDYARILVVWSGAPRGVAPTIASILGSVSNTGTVTSASTDHSRVESRASIKILLDLRVMLPPVTVTAGVLTNNAMTIPHASDRYQFERYIKLKDALVQLDVPGTGAIADFSTGAIYLVTIGNVAAGAEGYSVNMSSRFNYKE